MFAASIVREIKRTAGYRNLGLRDATDHLSTQGTFLVCLIVTTILTTKSFYLSPFVCMLTTAPSNAKLSNEYVNEYCFVHGTIPSLEGDKQMLVEMNNETAWKLRDNHDRISYYQWIPLYVGLVGVLAMLPFYMWQAVCDNWMSSDYEKVVQCAHTATRAKSSKDIESNLEDAAVTFHTMLSLLQPPTQTSSQDFPTRRQMRRAKRSTSIFTRCFTAFNEFVFFRRGGAYSRFLTYGYLLFKVTLLLMSLMQMYFLVSFLLGRSVSVELFTFLPTLFGRILRGEDWSVTGVFPRKSFCVVYFSYLGSTNNNFLAQCTLPMNMLNEKLFIFMWFWFAFLFVVNTWSGVWWILALMVPRSHASFLRHYLTKLPAEMAQGAGIEATPEELHHFAVNYLHEDGMFVMRMLQRDAGSWACSKVLIKLWHLSHTPAPKDEDEADEDGHPKANQHQ